MKEKIAEQLFLNDWDEGLLQGEILNGNWEESPKYLKNRYREQAKEKLALIAEEVRKVEKEAEETPRAWDGLGKAYQDGWENACQKVLGLLEGK